MGCAVYHRNLFVVMIGFARGGVTGQPGPMERGAEQGRRRNPHGKNPLQWIQSHRPRDPGKRKAPPITVKDDCQEPLAVTCLSRPVGVYTLDPIQRQEPNKCQYLVDELRRCVETTSIRSHTTGTLQPKTRLSLPDHLAWHPWTVEALVADR